MSKKKLFPSIEALEARIAPAAVVTYPTIKDAELSFDHNGLGDNHFVKAVSGTPILLKAGQVLTTGSTARSGSYLMFVEKGQALIFTTDLNNNGQVDYNEFTGIAAGDGLRLTSFVDIHGDIVTNLNANGKLSDSDSNASNNLVTGGDGRVLNNSSIEGITFRSVSAKDITDQNGDTFVDDTDVELRLAFTSYSLHGQIFAGKSFGVAGDTTSGLHIDDTGKVNQVNAFGVTGSNYYVASKPTVGAIRTGTAVNGEFFSFGSSRFADTQGDMTTFTPATGQVGGDISNIVSVNPYDFSGAFAGNAGLGARGGNISNVALNGDDAGGYNLVAGDGGRGVTGGAGGSIINFSDAGSVTGNVVIKTGNGGVGTNGLGGAGGSLGLAGVTVSIKGVPQIANLNVSGSVTIDLGDGGDGFRGGGAGAGLSNLVLRAPDDPIAYGNVIVATTHDRVLDPMTGALQTGGVIGRANGFDFDGDGFNDILYTSSNPDQVTVAFGDGAGDFGDGRFGDTLHAPIQLDAPSGVTAAAVGDLNGDGHPDVVVGSSKAGDFSGVTVFLSEYQNNNGQSVFVGFSSPRISPLPSLGSGDPNGGHTIDFKYRNTTNPISSIAIGDYDGDGVAEVAVTAGYVTKGALASIHQVLQILEPDIESGVANGHFYADMGTKAGNGLPALAVLPFEDLGIGDGASIQATALSLQGTYDVITSVRVVGTLTIGQYDGVDPALGNPNSGTHSRLEVFDYLNPFSGLTQHNDIDFQKIDTNRAAVQQTLVFATIKDYTIIDANHDGNADYVALSDTPGNYLMGFQGDGVDSNSGVLLKNPGSLDNSGYFIAAGSYVSLRASVPNDTASMSGIVMMDRTGVFYGSLTTYTFLDQTGFTVNPSVDGATARTRSGGSASSLNFEAIDTWITKVNSQRGPDPLDPLNPAAKIDLDTAGLYVNPYVSVSYLQTTYGHGFIDDQGEPNFGLGDFYLPLNDHFVDVHAGAGGDGVIGRGGVGGSIGTGKLTNSGTQLSGAIDITLQLVTLQSTPEVVVLTGGRGGDGFSSGGIGGGVSGVAARPNPNSNLVGGSVLLVGGDGGLGKSGAGGAGGSLTHNALYLGDLLRAGNGGDGLTGGNGGSILGHGISGYSDDTSPDQQLVAGNAGNGIRKGGIGGSVLNFHGQFSISSFGRVGGSLSYSAGDGGDAVAGSAGAGGDVTSVSPFTGGGSGTNLLAGDIYLKAGFGGDGSIGGRGGNIAGFVNQESQGTAPGLLAFIAGSGGAGVRGNGGVGGSVSGLSVSSTGTHTSSGASLSQYTYNHIIAGAGGSSSAAAGGKGGNVFSINTNASDGTYAVAGGAGGDGLLSGGIGGSVTSLSLELGGQTSKGLVVAGSGGSAGALSGDGTSSSSGFGGRIGVGGLGGSIIGFKQGGGTGSHVDLIAGDGGDSLNFGAVSSSQSYKYVGKGGSVKNVAVQGTIGNIDVATPIKSYNAVLAGETLASFVDSTLRAPTDASLIDDSKGNVGLVIGASGRLKSVFVRYDDNHQPVFRSIAATGAVNGDLINVRATAVLSAVAGNVERIAAIHLVRDLIDINIPPGSPLHAPYVGTDKAPTPDVVLPPGETDVLQYRAATEDGKLPDPLFPNDTSKRFYPTQPVIDGGLIDGALVSGTAPKMTVGGRLVDLSFISPDPNVGKSHRFVIS